MSFRFFLGEHLHWEIVHQVSFVGGAAAADGYHYTTTCKHHLLKFRILSATKILLAEMGGCWIWDELRQVAIGLRDDDKKEYHKRTTDNSMEIVCRDGLLRNRTFAQRQRRRQQWQLHSSTSIPSTRPAGPWRCNGRNSKPLLTS